MKLPEDTIIPVYRSDSSGTTAVFTDYLAKVSESWKSSVGAGKAIKWPTGLGGKGNEGVAAAVKNTPGTIGYVELTYANSVGRPVADIKNKSGAFVTASMKTVSEAAAASLKTMPADFRVSITDAEGKNAYPISSFTYLLVYSEGANAKSKEIIKFLNWAVSDGQKSAPSLSYAPLPNAMVKKVKDKIATLK